MNEQMNFNLNQIVEHKFKFNVNLSTHRIDRIAHFMKWAHFDNFVK